MAFGLDKEIATKQFEKMGASVGDSNKGCCIEVTTPKGTYEFMYNNGCYGEKGSSEPMKRGKQGFIKQIQSDME